ncbi:MAG: YegP family protein [Clostridia bacterium]|nr:YegP family protein [Clostridia bacterium]
MGKFVIKNTKTGIKFDLKAGNGEVIATSEVYKSLNSCKKGIASVQKNAPKAAIEDQTVEGFAKEKHPKFEIYKDKAGEFRFRLKATNGQIIAVGEGYKAMKGCVNGIESIKKNAADAKVEIIDKEEEEKPAKKPAQKKAAPKKAAPKKAAKK